MSYNESTGVITLTDSGINRGARPQGKAGGKAFSNIPLRRVNATTATLTVSPGLSGIAGTMSIVNPGTDPSTSVEFTL